MKPTTYAALCLLIGGVFSFNLHAESPPPIPPGYDTPSEAKEALLSGEIQIIDLIAPMPHHVKVTLDIEYSRPEGESLKLDLYQPRDLTEARPGVILIHGGGWVGGHRRTLQPHCVAFAERGYVVATISYRFADDHPYPAAIHDAKAAVRWMRANAKTYHIDPDMIAVIGGSAGAHLAMMVGYSSDVPELEGDGGNPGVSSRVQAVVNFYGPTDLTAKADRDKSVLVRFMGGKRYEEAEANYIQGSPITHLTPDDPPTLTLHGTIDSIVPFYQAETLDEKLRAVNVPHRLVPFEGWPHSMHLAKAVNDRCLWEIDQFFAEYLPLPQ